MKITLTEREAIHMKSVLKEVRLKTKEISSNNYSTEEKIIDRLLKASIGYVGYIDGVSRVKKIRNKEGKVQYLVYIDEQYLIDLMHTSVSIFTPFIKLIVPLKRAINEAIYAAKEFAKRYR